MSMLPNSPTNDPAGAHHEDPIYAEARAEVVVKKGSETQQTQQSTSPPSTSPPPTTTDNFKQYLIVIGMILSVAIPVGITLSTIRVPRPLMPPPQDFQSPWGYTISLLIFVVPILILAWWFLRYPTFRLERKAFWYTIFTLAPCGLVLDTLFGPSFFKFVNSESTLQIYGPGFVPGEGFQFVIPIEEYAFYFLGFLAILLIYIWSNLYWMRAYSDTDRTPLAQRITKIFVPNWPFFWIGLAMIILSFLYKRFGPHPYQEGFPGYFVFLALLGLLPSIAFFQTAQPLINWRAFSFTFFFIVLVSLIWEATVAIPYQWWGYHPEQMLGVMIFAWAQLPIEAVIVWVVVTWATVIFYEVIRVFFYMNKSYTEAFLGFLLEKPNQPPSA